MIENLTKEQEAHMSVVRDQYVGFGLSTEPADRPRAEAGMKLAYELAGVLSDTTGLGLITGAF